MITHLSGGSGDQEWEILMRQGPFDQTEELAWVAAKDQLFDPTYGWDGGQEGGANDGR